MSDEPAKGGTKPRDVLYAEAAKHTPRAIEVLVEIMEKGDNDNARMAAAKTILAKSLPDIKALEIAGPDGGPLQLRYIIDLAGGYIPPLGSFTPPPTASTEGSSPIQSLSVAQTSPQNDDSADRVSEASTV